VASEDESLKVSERGRSSEPSLARGYIPQASSPELDSEGYLSESKVQVNATEPIILVSISTPLYVRRTSKSKKPVLEKSFP